MDWKKPLEEFKAKMAEALKDKSDDEKKTILAAATDVVVAHGVGGVKVNGGGCGGYGWEIPQRGDKPGLRRYAARSRRARAAPTRSAPRLSAR